MAAAPPAVPSGSARPASDALQELKRAEEASRANPSAWRARKKVVEILESTGVPFDARSAQQHMRQIAQSQEAEAGAWAAAWARKHGDVALGCMLLSMGRVEVLEWLALAIDHSNKALVAALREYAVQNGDVPMLLRLAKHDLPAHLPALLTNMADCKHPEEWVVSVEAFAASLAADGSAEQAAALYHVLHGLTLPEECAVPVEAVQDALEHPADASTFRDRVRVFAKPLVALASAGGAVPAAVGVAASIVLRNPADFDAAQFVEGLALDAVDIAAKAIEQLASGDNAREVFRAAAQRFGVVVPAPGRSWRCW
jgi:hypothetical protein